MGGDERVGIGFISCVVFVFVRIVRILGNVLVCVVLIDLICVCVCGDFNIVVWVICGREILLLKCLCFIRNCEFFW